ncbi:MAG: protein-L-isoaspartate O-methyltransferase [Rhodospirillales bacterium]
MQEVARRKMVENQLRANKVTSDRILEAMGRLPRERFVPERYAGLAYVDEDLPLGGGRHALEPMVLARLVQALEVESDAIVLDVGCGLGYSTALLAALAGTVVAIEEERDLTDRANDILNEMGVDNAVVVEAPLAAGYPKQAPYDAILLNGAVPEIPEGLAQQLSPKGRMGLVVSSGAAMGVAMLVERFGDSLTTRVLFDAGTPLLPGFERQPGFVF